MILEIVQKIYKMKFLTAEIVKIGNSMNYFLKKKKKKTLNFFISSQLRKAIIDHVSDSFLDTTVPLLVLIEAAKNGREKEIKEYAAIFREHTSRLVEVSVLEL